MSFEELGLLKELSDRLSVNGITEPSEIQRDVFPLLKNGGSVIALSKTGTGKTLAYLAPLVQRYVYDLASETPPNETWGLVLVPTRELADQAEKNLRLLTDNQIQAVVIVGGESEKRQIEIGAKASIYVATPGRFLDLLDRKLVDVSHLKCVVFDEADRILDMGFINDIRKIREKLPEKLQLCFFSATIHFGIDEMSYEFGVEAERIGKEQDELTVEGLDHRVAFVGDHEKFHALAHFLKIRPDKRGIIFTNYRERAQELVTRLRGLGMRAELLTAKLTQAERSRTMQNFRDNKVQVLVASDLASRGLDVHDLDFVVNMALPEDSATYLHRVGRTARAGKKGIALSMIGFDDSFRLETLEKFLGKPIERFEFYPEELDGPLPRFSDAPLENTSGEPRAPHHTKRDAPSHKPQGQRSHGSRENRPHQGRGPAHRGPRQEKSGHAVNDRPVHQARPAPHHEKKLSSAAPAKTTQKGFFGKLITGVKGLLGIETELSSAAASSQQEKSQHSSQGRRHQHRHRPKSGRPQQGHRPRPAGAHKPKHK